MLLFETMTTRDAWRDWERLRIFLGSLLTRQQICLFLGAGVSAPFGLPNWEELVSGLAKQFGVADTNASLTIEERAELIVTTAGLSDGTLARSVHKTLYHEFDRDLRSLRKSDLLSALGSLAMGGRRGRVRSVVTFNYDDVLETYLSYHGFSVASTDAMPSLATCSDVEVYHPHGLLPLALDDQKAYKVLITRKHYDEVLGKPTPWRNLLGHLLSTHLSVFVGLSGSDTHLSQLLQGTVGRHPLSTFALPFSGIRFTKADDPRIDLWESRGVFSVLVDEWDEIPSLLLDVCQSAASLSS